MKLKCIFLLLFINLAIFSEEFNFKNQIQIEEALPKVKSDKLALQCISFIAEPNDFGCVPNHLRDLTISYALQSSYSYSIIWESFLSLPPMPNLESLHLSMLYVNAIAFDPQPEGGLRTFWRFIAQQFPNLKKLELVGFPLGGSLLLEFEKEDTLEELAELMPHLEELNLRSSMNYHSFPFGIDKFKELKALDLENTQFFYHLNKNRDFIFKLQNLEILKIGHMYAMPTPYDGGIACNYVGDFFQIGNLPNLKYLDLTALSLENLNLFDFSPHLKKLILDEVILNQSRLDQLASLEELEELSMSSMTFTAEHLEQLSLFSLPTLKVLNLASSNVKGVPFSQFSPDLRYLYLSETKISPADMKEIGQLINLENLQLKKTKISGHSLKHLKNLNHLKVLNLRGTNIRNGSLETLADLPNLQELDLSETPLSLEDFRKLFALTQLKTLKIEKLDNSNIGETELQELKSALPDCQIQF